MEKNPGGQKFWQRGEGRFREILSCPPQNACCPSNAPPNSETWRRRWTKRMTETLQSEDLNVIDAITIIESTVKSLETINNDIDGMNAEIKAAELFAKKLGTNVESDFRRFHHPRKPPRRIDDNPNTTANLSVESYYRKEFRTVLDTQINTFADFVDKCSITIKPLFGTLGIGKEPSSVPNFEDLAKLHPDRPDPDALMCEMEIFKIHCEKNLTFKIFVVESR